MAVCEKCWADAGRRAVSNPHKSQTEHYYDLLEERKDNPCEKCQRINDEADYDAAYYRDIGRHGRG
jgi:hypothetical protein